MRVWRHEEFSSLRKRHHYFRTSCRTRVTEKQNQATSNKSETSATSRRQQSAIMSTFYQAAKLSQRSKQLVNLAALSKNANGLVRKLTPGASSPLTRNSSRACLGRKKNAATTCAATYHEDEDQQTHMEQGKTSRRSVSNFAAAIPIALVGLFRQKGRRARADDYSDESFMDFLEEDSGSYHHEYFHSGVAEKLANMGISDD